MYETNYYKVTVSKKINVGKYDFLIREDVLPEKELLVKTATIKIFEYSPLSSELKHKLTLKKVNISFLKIKMKNDQRKKMVSRWKMVSKQKLVPKQKMVN